MCLFGAFLRVQNCYVAGENFKNITSDLAEKEEVKILSLSRERNDSECLLQLLRFE